MRFKKGGTVITTLDLGKVTIATAVATSIDIENTGKASILSPTLTLDSASDKEFTLSADTVTPGKELKAGEAGSATITFESAAAGTYKGTLLVAGSNLSATAKLPLSVTV